MGWWAELIGQIGAELLGGMASENLEKVPQKKFFKWIVILVILIFGIVIYYLFLR